MTAVTSSATSVSRGKRGNGDTRVVSPCTCLFHQEVKCFPEDPICASWFRTASHGRFLGGGAPASKVEAVMAEGCSQSGACKGVPKTDGREDAACERGWSQLHWSTAVCCRGWLHNPVPASWTMLAFSQGWELESRQPGGNLWMQTDQSSWWKAVSSAKKVLILFKKKKKNSKILHCTESLQSVRYPGSDIWYSMVLRSKHRSPTF